MYMILSYFQKIMTYINTHRHFVPIYRVAIEVERPPICEFILFAHLYAGTIPMKRRNI